LAWAIGSSPQSEAHRATADPPTRKAIAMGLFTKRKSRATRRAEARALKAKAKMEAKLAAKNEGKRIRATQRTENKAVKAQLKPSCEPPGKESCWRQAGSVAP